MRIIAGEAKGRKLKSIKGTPTRPTLDRVKESIFNIINFYVPGSSGLDLFAGFGSLGLEAISRGADRITFVELNYKNANLITANLELCGFTDRGAVIKDNVLTYLENCREIFDLILMDPPYEKGLAEKSLDLICRGDILKEKGIIVVEHSKTEVFAEKGNLIKIRENNYGDTGITIFQKIEEDA